MRCCVNANKLSTNQNRNIPGKIIELMGNFKEGPEIARAGLHLQLHLQVFLRKWKTISTLLM